MTVIADWRDERAYPVADGEIILSRWHREFFRRNIDYQRDYDQFRQIENDSDGIRHKHSLARKYGLEDIMVDYHNDLRNL